MRYGIFSDIHSNLEAFDAVIEALQSESIDKYLCVGDVVSYATNPNECITKVKALVAASVVGNHDWASIKLFSLEYFNAQAAEAIEWTMRHLNEESKNFLMAQKLVFKNDDLTLVHSRLDNPRDFDYMLNGYAAWETFRLLETGICFVGHSHVAGVFMRDTKDDVYYREEEIVEIKDENKYIINVGSVGQPRDGNPDACFCIYDTDTKIMSVKRAQYDFQKTRHKIIKAGLPQYLGDRLLIGR